MKRIAAFAMLALCQCALAQSEPPIDLPQGATRLSFTGAVFDYVVSGTAPNLKTATAWSGLAIVRLPDKTCAQISRSNLKMVKTPTGQTVKYDEETSPVPCPMQETIAANR